jgi:hypothetical protein
MVQLFYLLKVLYISSCAKFKSTIHYYYDY